MINLKEELVKTQQKEKAKIETFTGLDEVKQLLANNSGEEREILKAFSLDDNIKKVEAERGKIIRIEQMTEKYGEAYHIDMIETLAIDYNLRFLPLQRYKGAIDPLLAAKLARFGKENNINVINESDQFYLLAPANTFDLERVERPVVAKDPLLFYKPDRYGDVWILVHQWGEDFTFLKLLSAFPKRNVICHRVTLIFKITCAVTILSSLLMPVTFSLWFIVLFSFIVSLPVSWGVIIGNPDENSREREHRLKKYSEYSWNKKDYYA